MMIVSIPLDDVTAVFYQRVAQRLQRPVEQVLADALFQLAGELSLEALSRKNVEIPVDFGE